MKHWLLRSAAWKSLSRGARCLLIEVWQRHNGQNNGRISYSVREAAAALNVSKNTAAKWFSELEEKGFLRARQRGSFDYKLRHATVWIITAEPYGDEAASKDFMEWRPDSEKQNPVPLKGSDGPSERDRGAQGASPKHPLGPTERDRNPSKEAFHGPTERDTYSLPGRGPNSVGPSGQGNVIKMPEIPEFLDRRRNRS